MTINDYREFLNNPEKISKVYSAWHDYFTDYREACRTGNWFYFVKNNDNHTLLGVIYGKC